MGDGAAEVTEQVDLETQANRWVRSALDLQDANADLYSHPLRHIDDRVDKLLEAALNLLDEGAWLWETPEADYVREQVKALRVALGICGECAGEGKVLTEPMERTEDRKDWKWQPCPTCDGTGKLSEP